MSPLTLKWRDVEVGMSVDLGGDAYVVEKAKTKGKVVKVTVNGKRGRFSREMKAKDEVAIARREVNKPSKGKRPRSKADAPATGGPLHDEAGAQRRWAEPGDLKATKPPKKAKGGEWDKPADKAEKRLVKGLGAKLIGATGNAELGWYVPKPDASTLAAHLLLFHDIELEANDYAAALKLHEDNHERAKVAPFTALHVNHWHTKERPEL